MADKQGSSWQTELRRKKGRKKGRIFLSQDLWQVF